jgi:small subunit ribosomal protein S29
MVIPLSLPNSHAYNSTARDLTSATTSYAPLPNTNPTQYVQKHYTAKLLARIRLANESVLSKLTLQSVPPGNFPLRLQQNTTLAQLAEMGASDPEIAWDTFYLLWQQLTTPCSSSSEPRPPILLAIDSFTHLMTETKYMSSDFKHVHAHDLALVNHFLSYLSGAKSLGPSGGMVLAATSESNNPRVHSFEFAAKQLLAQQSQQLSTHKLSASPDQAGNVLPIPDPWKPLDARVMDVMTGLPNGLVNETDKKKRRQFGGVGVQKLEGLSKEETRSLIEYFAKSGLLRNAVDDDLVARTWTLSGGGVIEEVENSIMSFRVGDDKDESVRERRNRRR